MLREFASMASGLLFLHGHFTGFEALRSAPGSGTRSSTGGTRPAVGPQRTCRPAAGLPEKSITRGAQVASRGTASARPLSSARAGGWVATRAMSRDWLTAIELLALGAIWGGSFLFMRVAAGEFGPLALVDVRLALGALVLAPFLWRARARFTGHLWWGIAAIGVLNSALPFVLFAWGAERAPAGVSAIVNSMVVPFTALVAFAAFGERIGTARAIALVAGFVGVVVLASGRTAGSDIGPAVAAGTVAALCYGISVNLVKHYLADLPPIAVAAATLLCGALLLAPLAVATWPETPIAATSWLSAVLLGVLCTGIAYAFYFRLIQRVGAARASTSTYLVPLFGVAWGWLLLGEPLTPTMAVAGTLILGSVVLAQREARRIQPLPTGGVVAACGR